MLYLQTHQGGLTTEILKQRYTIIRVVCLITRQAAIHISFKCVCDHHLTTKQATIKDSLQDICLSWEFNRCEELCGRGLLLHTTNSNDMKTEQAAYLIAELSIKKTDCFGHATI